MQKLIRSNRHSLSTHSFAGIKRRTIGAAATQILATIGVLFMSAVYGRTDDRLVGVWGGDDGSQIIEFLFRSDGRYQLDTKNVDPAVDISLTERGLYAVTGKLLTLTPYEQFGEPQSKRYEFELAGDSLSLTTDFGLTQIYQFKIGSKADVLAREKVDAVLTGTWIRSIPFFGKEEFTFRPDGYFIARDISLDGEVSPEIKRGRYQQTGTRLTIKPYGGSEASYELDFFGDSLTLIKKEELHGESLTYQQVPGSRADVLARAAEAEAVLSRSNWHVGVWEIRDGVNTVDLTLRPDGFYISTNATPSLNGIVRGRYSIESGVIRFSPFLGQYIYSRDNGDFGNVERTRTLDYFDGELQLIDPEALTFPVTLARKRLGTEVIVMDKAQQAHVERTREGWHIGIWEVNDPAGWMEFTFRPDNRYIAKAGAKGVPSQVERGRYVIRDNKITLAPYAGLGAARGFDLDLYDGDLYLIGDSQRMVIAGKILGSDSVVIEKTLNPDSMKGERGSILGLWTANMPGENVELIFRPDGQFRLNRCASGIISRDYGLYSVNMDNRTMVFDSRLAEAKTPSLDFYGDTLTIHDGGFSPPQTYTVNLGRVDASIEASLQADVVREQIDDQWLARVPTGLRNPRAVQVPTGDIPSDPNPELVFDAPTVFANYQLYRRLIPGFVYFHYLGELRSVAVVNTREWHFFPTGRVMVRFKNHSAGAVYPATVTDVSESWGAYHIGAKPAQQDVFHLFADNDLFIEMDLGEKVEMTLEEGRRYLFWKRII